MTSEERRAARRARRVERRAAKRAARLAGCTLEAVADPANLRRAQRQAARGVGWKASTQRYMRDWLLNLFRTRADLLAGRSVHRGFHEFDVVERGKLRHISSVHFSERVPQKSLAQNVLVPALTPTLIARNTANIRGRGLSAALAGLKRDMARHWRAHGAEGWVLLVDFRRYFDSIAHGPLKAQLEAALDDEGALRLAGALVDLQGARGLGLGCEPNQIEAVAFLNRLDHLTCEVLRPEGYGRYMDDAYLIDADKGLLLECLERWREEAAALGLELSGGKTRLVKLSKGFSWLKMRVCYSPTGRVVMRPGRETVTRERRRLRAMAAKVAAGEMAAAEMRQSFAAWAGGMRGLDARRTARSTERYMETLLEGATS